MIGMINMPSDSPVEYYAAPRGFDTPTPQSPLSQRPTSLKLGATTSSSIPILSPSYLPRAPLASPTTKDKIKSSLRLFIQHKTPTAGYCPDGRKCKDGRPINTSAPRQLWDELLMKQMVRRIEEEIMSPVEQLENIDKSFKSMHLKNRDRVMSAPSLVSDNKTYTGMRICDACQAAINEEELQRHNEEAHSRRGSECSSNHLRVSAQPSLSSAPGSVADLSRP